MEGGVEGRLASDEGRAALVKLAQRASASDGAGGCLHRIALLCSEARWCECHRAALARELIARHHCAVMHILPGGRLERHPESIRERLQAVASTPWASCRTVERR